MADTSLLSTSVNTSVDGCSPHTPLSIDQTLLQSPAHKLPIDHKALGASDYPVPIVLPPYGTPQSQLPHSEVPSALRKHTLKAKGRLQRMYTPYMVRTLPPPLELQFAMRAMGRTSHTSLTLADIVEGKDVFKKGLSLMPTEVFNKFYTAKVASKDYILSCISTTLREVDALEKEKDALLEYEKHEKQRLAAACMEVQLFKEEAETRASDISNDVTFRHAIYADDLAALTVINTQLNDMLALSDPEPESDDTDSSSDMSNDHMDEVDDEDDENGHAEDAGHDD